MTWWLHALVNFVATKKGMSAALALAVSKDSDLFSYSSDLLMRSAGGLLDRAIAAGAIRNDIGPEDLIRTLVGMCYTHDQPGWQKSVLRLGDIFIEGLRSRRAKRQTNTNKNVTLDWYAGRCPKWVNSAADPPAINFYLGETSPRERKGRGQNNERRASLLMRETEPIHSPGPSAPRCDARS